MSDSDSSDDDLGLFSFANKKMIVAEPPVTPTEIVPEVTPKDMSLFKRNDKRKRMYAPWIIDENLNQSGDMVQTGNTESADTSITDDNDQSINEKIRQYDSIVDNICNIDQTALENQVGILPANKKFKKTTEQRNKLIDKLGGVLNKYKSTIKMSTIQDDSPLPESSSAISDETVNTERPILIKMRKGSALHRFKIKMDTPLKTVLDHLAPLYSIIPSHIILQLNDETIDPCKSPSQLGITVADIIDVLVGTAPQDTTGAQQTIDDVNAMKIKIQSTQHRNNLKEYTVFKNKPLQEYLFQACKDFGYEAAKYYFDGDTIDPRKTPEQLDIEEFDCIDIVELT